MAVIEINSSKGLKILECFDTADDVPYLDMETGFETDPFDDIAELEPE